MCRREVVPLRASWYERAPMISFHSSNLITSGFVALLVFAGCAAPRPTLEAAPPASPTTRSDSVEGPPAASNQAAAPASANLARGGRLYDNWVSEKGLKKTFTVDSSKTPELDGVGGPNQNGTLNDGAGQPLANTGHDYRFKNLFGWDLRGKAGIYGPDAQKKPFVLDVNLLSDTKSEAELVAWFKAGDARLPAWGAVLDDADLRDLAAFIVAVRSHALPQPTDVFALDPAAPKNYRLLAGADARRGASTFRARCAECHGVAGAEFFIDDVETVGTLSRTSGYEIWLKIMNGHPGSPMGPQVKEADGSGAEQGRLILDVLAALCDRGAFVQGKGEDVRDGDARCGAYLK